MKRCDRTGLPATDLKRRAVDAVVWGMPIVAVDAMRQAFFRDAGAGYGDILYWSKPTAWTFQSTTDGSTRYIYFNFNLKDGPFVLDVPAAEGAGLFGSIVDAWQVPVADIGPAGKDEGKGGKYVFVPPGSTQSIPRGYIGVRLETFNGYCLLRAISTTSAGEDVTKAIGLLKRLRLYPLARASNPPLQKYIDMSDRRLAGVVQFDESFFERLARMVNEEPISPRDFFAMSRLRALGIEKGRAFKPDTFLTPILRQAAADALARFMLGVSGGSRVAEARTATSSRRRRQRPALPFRPTPAPTSMSKG